MARRASQLDLFANATGPAAPRKSGLDPAPVRPEHAALAARLPQGAWLGTSTWSFPGWAGIVYDGQASESALAHDGLRAYARHPLLRAVGIDRTHYAPIGREVFAGYAAQAPAAFRFIVKAHEQLTLSRFPDHPRYGAHRGLTNPRFLDAAYAAEEVVRPFVEGLGPKAGPLVFQFAPQDVHPLGGPEAFAELLYGFLSRLPRGPVYAVEVRNPELLTRAYAAALHDTGAAHCFNAWGRMPPVEWQEGRVFAWDAPALVARWILPRGHDYDEMYRRFFPYTRLVEEDLGVRRGLADLVRRATAAGMPAYVTVNNKAEGCAPESVFRLAAEVAAAEG